MRHYQKVHPRHALSSAPARLETKQPSNFWRRRNRRILFFALIGLVVILASVIAVQEINANTVRMRISSQLSVLIDGAPYTVPANIGIDHGLWIDHSLDRYGVGGRSPLLTRDDSGTVYVESNTLRSFTLYEFLAVWGKSVDNTQVVGIPVQSGESVCIVVNGQTMSYLNDLPLTDQEKITLEIVSGTCSAVS